MLWQKYRWVWQKYRGMWRKLEKSGENCKSGGEKKIHGHQGPSWTAVYMSPFTSMQVDLESWSKLKLRLKVEKFIKEYVSLILLLSTIFTAAVGMILSNSQLCILSCSSHRDQNNFWPKWISCIISCMMHTATMSQHQTALS